MKSCRETGGLDYCGQCLDFLCEITENMGKAQGYDPAPGLENCRKRAQARN